MKKWKILSIEDVSPSKWFPLSKHTVEVASGAIIDDFYVSHLGDVSMNVVVLPNKKTLWVKQYKHGVQDFTLELPAGRIKKGLTPEEAARLELKEETGYEVKKMRELGKSCPQPTKDGSVVYGFLSNEVVSIGETNFDVTEDVEIIELSKSEVLEKINSGEIYGSDSIAIFYKALLKFPEMF